MAAITNYGELTAAQPMLSDPIELGEARFYRLMRSEDLSASVLEPKQPAHGNTFRTDSYSRAVWKSLVCHEVDKLSMLLRGDKIQH